MNRRGFLQVLAAVTGAAALGVDLSPPVQEFKHVSYSKTMVMRAKYAEMLAERLPYLDEMLWDSFESKSRTYEEME